MLFWIVISHKKTSFFVDSKTLQSLTLCVVSGLTPSMGCEIVYCICRHKKRRSQITQEQYFSDQSIEEKRHISLSPSLADLGRQVVSRFRLLHRLA